MHQPLEFSETVITTAEPQRTFRLAEECLLAIRLVESKRTSVIWQYEYEVTGQFGRIEKFLSRLKLVDTDVMDD